MSPRGRSRSAQEAPRPPQEHPKRLQEAAKSAPGGSKRATRDPRAGQEDKSFFEILICLACNYCECFVSLLHVRKASKLQICTAQMPCHRMADGHAKTWRAGGGVPPKGKAIRKTYVQQRTSFKEPFKEGYYSYSICSYFKKTGVNAA